MVDIWKKIYGSSSITLKALAFIPYLWTFLKTYHFLKKSQYWNSEQIEQYQTTQFKKLIEHAYTNVPYYKRIFDERNLKPEDIQTLSDLQKLPFLTKEIVRENIVDLKAQNFPKSSFEYVTTGGSTGIPLGFYYEKGVSRAQEWAFMKIQWERVGYHFLDKCAVLRGAVIPTASEGIFWQKTFFGRWLLLSSYHMTDENMSRYIEILRAFKPKYIHAYPSSITLLAQFMRRNHVPNFTSVKAIFCGSEILYSWQRELIELTLNCRIYSWYGNSEQTVLAGECEQNAAYHIFPEYGVVELIDNEGNLILNPDVMGEIVSTNLNNFVFPFIRYKSLDLGTITEEKCHCGRNHKLLTHIEGRLQEFIITKTGRLISMVALNMHSEIFDNVKQFQFYQEKIGEVTIRIIKNSAYSDYDTQVIQTELMKKLGEDTKLSIQFVDAIPRTEQGKFRFLLQKIPIQPFFRGYV